MALSLSRPRHRSLSNPYLIHLFSSSSTTPSDDPTVSEPQQQQQQQQQSSLSSYFNDVKASLKQQNPENRPNSLPSSKPTYSTNQSFSKPTNNVASYDEIRKNLSEFRLRSSDPPPRDPNSASSQDPSSKQHISFQELYKRNLARSTGGNGTNQSGGISANQPISGGLTFDAIRESLRQIKGGGENNNTAVGRGRVGALPFSSFKLKPGNENESMNKSTIIGGTEGLPSAVFGREMEGEGRAKGEMSTEFVKMYSHGELGDKLRSLRPTVKRGEKGWFTLKELNERLRKLREMEEKETESRISGFSYRDLRESLVKLKASNDEKAIKNSVQRLNLMGQLRASNVMLQPPKKHLYFHPDNMSSSEKMKIELARVRDEFKMSESDCGSARVQVALLTTKIKHLSSVLNKKDKHSRKGLIGMVQKRKKLLKYLRRTDWDSYCLVLSKLGLRDNPDHKTLTRL
uniref:Small ribosomal subunit protein uS15c n=1 Tax=Salix viminalis TaxID=40686 RepID=A0A6N2JWH7_SALVM